MQLELKGVFKKYDAVEGVEAAPVLRDISLSVNAGESLAVSGPSGSGKTTLLNLIGALDRPSEGEVLLEGQDLSKCSDEELAQIRRKKIGFVFQSHHLLPQCTALENVLIPTLAYRSDTSRQETADRAKLLMERVGLGHRLAHRPGLLSGGECQRVAVVRALINRPGLLLADEPTGALDDQSSESLADLLCELNREERVTLIVVTHMTQLASRMERKYQLCAGRFSPIE